MTTVAQDMTTILTGEVESAFPGTNNILGYYDAVKMTLTAASSIATPANWLLYAVIRDVLGARPQDEVFNLDQTTGERQALYLDIISKLQAKSDILDALITALTTAEGAL